MVRLRAVHKAPRSALRAHCDATAEDCLHTAARGFVAVAGSSGARARTSCGGRNFDEVGEGLENAPQTGHRGLLARLCEHLRERARADVAVRVVELLAVAGRLLERAQHARILRA